MSYTKADRIRKAEWHRSSPDDELFTTEMAYDPAGRVTTIHHYDGSGTLARGYATEPHPPAPSPKGEGENDTRRPPLSPRRGAAECKRRGVRLRNPDSSWDWMLHDGLGSVRGVFDGTLQSAAEYDPFGEPIVAPAGTAYGFTGELTDVVHLRGQVHQPETYPNWNWMEAGDQF